MDAVANAYGFHKKLEFVDRRNDKITIDSQETFKYVVYEAIHAELERFMEGLKMSNK